MTVRQIFLGNGKNQQQKNVIWNMIGSVMAALVTVVLMSVAGRATGETGGATFTAAYTMAQQFLTIGYFEMRAFQVTDLHRVYSFEDYFTFRILTCLAMLLAGFCYAFVTGGGGVRVTVTILVCAYKMLDALADVFEGEFQKDDRLDLSGKSLTVRMIFSIAGFSFTAYLTGNIVLASLAALIFGALAVLLMDFYMVRSFAVPKIHFSKNQLSGIFKDCVLLFVGSFFNLYLTNAAKYAGERFLSAAEYYAFTAAIFMPANVINLISGFLFRPALVTMSRDFEEKRYHEFERLIGLLFAGIVLITVVVIAGAALLGIPILEWIYAVELSPYKTEMLIVIAGGGGFALSIILYYVLTVMRRQKFLCLGYILTTILTLPVPYVLTGRFGMRGTAVSFVILMAAQTVVLFVIALCCYLSDKRKEGSGRC